MIKVVFKKKYSLIVFKTYMRFNSLVKKLR